jgi:hypothetical protein
MQPPTVTKHGKPAVLLRPDGYERLRELDRGAGTVVRARGNREARADQEEPSDVVWAAKQMMPTRLRGREVPIRHLL